MSEGLRQMSPKDGYVVNTKAHIGSTEFKVILKLYQPLMGVNAYGVYSLLATKVAQTPDLLARRMHKELLDILSLGLRDFYEARIRLEALGLLKTFVQKDELGQVFIYELQAPLSAEAFFKDDLLSMLLADSLGQTQYDELKQEFVKPDLTYANAKEITKSLLDVFTVKKDALLKNSQVKAIPKPTKNLVDSVEVDLDVEYLKELLARSFVPATEISRSLGTLKSISLLYGLDELELVKLLEQALNVKDDKVDLELVKKLATQQFDRQFKEITPKESKVTEPVDPAVSAELTQTDLALIAVSKQYLPLEFIEELKRQKHSFVTNLERYTVKNLVEKQVLPNAVINVLLHYYLIAQNNTMLEDKVANRFTKAAAKLAEKKIQTPEEAMLYMREANQKAREKQKQKQYYGRKQQVVQKETLPDWAKTKENKAVSKPAKEDKQALNAEIDELLAQLEQSE